MATTQNVLAKKHCRITKTNWTDSHEESVSGTEVTLSLFSKTSLLCHKYSFGNEGSLKIIQESPVLEGCPRSCKLNEKSFQQWSEKNISLSSPPLSPSRFLLPLCFRSLGNAVINYRTLMNALHLWGPFLATHSSFTTTLQELWKWEKWKYLHYGRCLVVSLTHKEVYKSQAW